MYQEYFAVRSSIVFEFIYRDREDTRTALKSIIASSANTVLENMSGAVLGTSASFTSENMEIYYDIHGGKFSKAVAALIEDIYKKNVADADTSLMSLMDKTLNTVVNEVFIDKMTTKEKAAAMIATYFKAVELKEAGTLNNYPKFKAFYEEFEEDVSSYVAKKANMPLVAEELLANESYSQNAILGRRVSSDALSYYNTIVNVLEEEEDQFIVNNLKTDMYVNTNGTVMNGLYQSVAYYVQSSIEGEAETTGAGRKRHDDDARNANDRHVPYRSAEVGELQYVLGRIVRLEPGRRSV